MRPEKIGAGLALAVMLITAVAAAANPAVLQEVPANSQLVVVTQPLSQLGAKVNMFAQQAGLIPPMDGQQEAVNMPEMLGAELGIAGQIDASRGLALAVADLMDMERTAMAFIPVTDATAAVQMMGAQPAPGVPGVFLLPDPDMFQYLAPAGKYLLLGSDSQQLRLMPTVAKGYQVTPVEQGILSNSEVGVLVDLTAVMPEARKELLAAIADEPQLAQHLSLKNLLISAVDRLGETQKAAAGLSFRPEGIALTIRAQAAQGSTLAQYLSGHPKTGIGILSKLPAQSWMSASVYRFDPKLIVGPINALAEAIKQDPTVQGKIQPADLEQVRQALADVYTTAMSGTAAEAGYIVGAGDPKAMIAQLNAFETASQMQSVPQALNLISGPAAQIASQAGYPVSASYEENAGTVDSTQYSKWTLDLSQVDLPAEAMQALQMHLTGDMTMEYLLANLPNQRLAVARDEAALNTLVGLAQTGGLDQEPALAKSAKNLPPQANAYLFVQPGRMVQVMMQAMMAQAQQQGPNPMLMMMPMFTQIQGAIGTAVTAEDGALQVDLFVPNEVVQSSVGMFMQMQMGMMGPGTGAQQEGQW